MIVKKSKPPTTQRKFLSPWLELEYVLKRIHFWLYTRGQIARAGRYVERLKRVLNELPKNNLAISRQEGLALLFELTGDLNKAIAHRKREIELIERLHREARLPRYDEKARAYLLQGREDAALQDRRDILQRLKVQKRGSNNNGVGKTH